MEYSVLMSVYHREKPEYLRESMQSIADQTCPTDDFILVCDGPLGPELDAVIKEMQLHFGDALHVIRYPENRGLGYALNKGLGQCRHEYIVRMDSDDISYPERCEQELRVIEEKGVDVVSAAVAEFDGSTDNVDVIRMPPETHEEILEFAKRRNPFNHPCSIYRKSAVMAAGGYQDFYLLEDYYLWVRMLLNGAKGYNIQYPLLWMRAGTEMYRRRSGFAYAKTQRNLFRYMLDRRFISRGNYICSCVIRTASACSPNWIREGLFKMLLRKNPERVRSGPVKFL